MLNKVSGCLLDKLFAMRASKGRFRNRLVAVRAVKDNRGASGGLPEAADFDRHNPRRISFAHGGALLDDSFSN
jgi:hypothetical protein